MTPPQPQRSGRLVVLVGLAVLLDTAFFTAIAPLLPHLEREIGLSSAAAGFLVATYPIGVIVGVLPARAAARRVGPKRTLLIGMALLFGSCVLFGIARDVVLLDLSRFVQGVSGSLTFAGGMAWVVAARRDRRGEVIGQAMAIALAGTLLGPIIGLIAHDVSQVAAFSLVAVAVAVVGGLLARETEAGRVGLRGEPFRLTPPLTAGLAVLAVVGVAFGVLGVAVPLELADLGVSSVLIGGAFLVAAALQAVASPFGGRLHDRCGPLLPLSLALLGSACATMGPVVLAGAAPLIGALLLTSLTLGGSLAPSMAVVSEHTEILRTTQTDSFLAINVIWAAGQIVGAWGTGAVLDSAGHKGPFVAISVMACLTLACVMVVDRTWGFQMPQGSS